MTAGLPAHLSALLRPQAYTHVVRKVELVETHISWVLLTGEYAYKVKRPVRYTFVDLTSSERRAFFCGEELRLNRRFAPELYVEVCDIVAGAEGARVGGPGEVIEHAVRMRQFEREDELDRLLAADRIAPPELDAFGRKLAAIHARLPVVPPADPWGRPADVRRLLLENLEQCLQASQSLGTDAELKGLCRAWPTRVEAAEPLFALRRDNGRVRECHGDLHARNIVRRSGRLIAFDCLEFDPAMRWIDVADEIAFLAMDLGARRAPGHAHALRSGYLAASGDYQACRLLALYQLHRALVRAKVTALEFAGVSESGAREAARAQHEVYVESVRRLLTPAQPRLLLMCGLSGSGKTWLAQRLAPLLDAVHLRSDVERKRLAGLAEQARTGSAPGQGLYSARINDQVYEHLERCADEILAGGYTVIVDATFHRRADRLRFRDWAARRGVQAEFIHCHAPRELLEQRIAARERPSRDASEADSAILRWQEAHLEPVRADEQLARIDADTTRPNIVAETFDRIAARR